MKESKAEAIPPSSHLPIAAFILSDEAKPLLFEATEPTRLFLTPTPSRYQLNPASLFTNQDYRKKPTLTPLYLNIETYIN